MEIDEEVTSELKPKTYQSVLNEKKKKNVYGIEGIFVTEPNNTGFTVFFIFSSQNLYLNWVALIITHQIRFFSPTGFVNYFTESLNIFINTSLLPYLLREVQLPLLWEEILNEKHLK